VSCSDLKQEFEYYGPVVDVKLVHDSRNGRSRGYAFVEFENSADLTEAYKDADGRKINGRRILVDVERGRTVKNWKPRRLGGGLGNKQTNKYKMNGCNHGMYSCWCASVVCVV
jgi:U1 small nuclear ribonucleoprotein